MNATQPEQPASLVGPAIILVGAALFVVACFLPFYEFAALPRHEATISLYRLNVTGFPSGGLASRVGGFVSLFTGVAVIGLDRNPSPPKAAPDVETPGIGRRGCRLVPLVVRGASPVNHSPVVP